MHLSLNWLKDYLAKSDMRINPEDLADKLTMRGLSVANVSHAKSGLDNVMVARIEKISKHPNADRLQVTEVVFSEEPNAERHQIVCGAKNIAEGDIVPVALPGAILPGDFEIKKSAIRGVDSSGMICSGKELGISDESEGILQLPKHTHLGQPVARLIGAQQDDTILEFELTPNRADCLSVMGLAREIAPLLKTKMREPKPARFRNSTHRTSAIIKVEVNDPTVCPRYVARVIDGLKVTDSPDWIKQRLQAIGMRPVNNIVDITNFVMMEYGQPLHAFDLRKIQSGSLRVGTCQMQQEFTTLTGETVTLEPGDILILDGDRPVAIAGIMGGANTQVEADTTSILLESAAFPAAQIRKTAKRLGLSTESSKRFEKGHDLAAVAFASERAACLLRDSFNANVYHPPIDTNEYGVKEHVIAVDMRDVRRITGMKDLSSETAAEALETVNIISHKKSINILTVRLPSFRPDLTESIDIIEEVARLVGYDHIPLSYPSSLSSYERFDDSMFDFEYRTRHILVSLGLREAVHYSFTSESQIEKYGLLHEGMISIQNPISEDMKVMRTSLVPSLLETYTYNRNRKISDQKIFELSRVYQKDDTSETKAKETPTIAGLISGNVISNSWVKTPSPVDFYHAKAVVESLCKQLTTVKLSFEPPRTTRLLHPNRSAVLKLGLKEVGFVGEVHPYVKKCVLDTEEPLVVFEIDLEALKKYERNSVRFKGISKFPSVELDIALLVESAVASQSLIDVIRQNGGALLTDVSVFDAYEGEHVPVGKKSLAFHLVFQTPERTLNDAEVVALKDKIVSALAEKHQASLRA